MDGQRLPFQLLLLVFPVAAAYDTYPGTTVAPYNTSTSSEIVKNATDSHQDVGMIYAYWAETCWLDFEHKMTNVSKVQWCEWRTISRPYTKLRECLEHYADQLNCSFPNTVAEIYIVISHQKYFLNCSLEHPILMDPPENVLLSLIITPICLIPFLVTLVVLKSKDSEMKG